MQTFGLPADNMALMIGIWAKFSAENYINRTVDIIKRG
jgi:hypothetical protein